MKLTRDEKDVLAQVKNGGDIYNYSVAMMLRRLEKRGLVKIVKAMDPPPGHHQQPYFGAIAVKLASGESGVEK